jgi:hypothetical protein
MKFILTVAILAIASLTSGQETPTPADPVEFFAQVVRYQGTGTPPYRNSLTNGVMSGYNHAIVPASFVNNIPLAEMRVYLQSILLRTSQDIREVTEVHIHPDFVATSPDANNIAVLRLSDSRLDTNEVAPRGLGALTARTCTIYGFQDWTLNLTTVQATITNQGCRGNNPFCANFPVTTAGCGGFVGSPVICENQGYVAGIANIDSNCIAFQNATVTFLSIEPFADWIRYVSSAKVTAQVSLAVMLVGVVLRKLL